MYAWARIPDYWIVDLNHDRVEVYRDPSRSRYRSVTRLRRADTVSPLCAPDLAIDVTTMLGQPRAE
jgi:Uma2 family endonuclease